MKRPSSLEEARSARGEYRAGGTDLHARRRLGLSTGEIVDLRHLSGLTGIRRHDAGMRIGAMARVTAVGSHPEIVSGYPALAAAAGSLATPQIRSMATVGGNLLQRNRCPYFRHPGFSCHKSGGDTCPAREGDHRHGVIFDLGPCVSPHPSTLAMALLAYDAGAELGDGRGVTVAELMGDGSDGRRDHLLPEGEVLVAVEMPGAIRGELGAYRRATGRALAEWPDAEAVCRLVVSGDRIDQAAVAVGGVAPVPLRRSGTEAALAGVRLDDSTAQREAARLVTDGATPLPATGHKVDLLRNVVLATIRAAAEGGGGGELAPGERPLGGDPDRR